MLKIRAHFSGYNKLVQNLGDALTPHLLGGLGFGFANLHSVDADVINPGRCLLVIGSTLTSHYLQQFDMPIDVWGCGWKGPEAWRMLEADIHFHAVRGPETAAGIGLAETIPQGDPALLIPHLFSRPLQSHGETLLIPHIHRVFSAKAASLAEAAGCDEIRSPLVFAPLRHVSPSGALSDLQHWRRLHRAGVHGLWDTVDRIAGASFVLTGSLHGAILAQAYGVPWAAFTDGHVDSPAKWEDWGAYLGVGIAFARTLSEGKSWWRDVGQAGSIRDLWPLVRAFPYLERSPQAAKLTALSRL